jgi:hypothetical protein
MLMTSLKHALSLLSPNTRLAAILLASAAALPAGTPLAASAAAQSFYASALTDEKGTVDPGPGTPPSPGFAGQARGFAEQGFDAQSRSALPASAGSSGPIAARETDQPASFVERALSAQGVFGQASGLDLSQAAE